MSQYVLLRAAQHGKPSSKRTEKHKATPGCVFRSVSGGWGDTDPESEQEKKSKRSATIGTGTARRRQTRATLLPT